MFKDNFFKKVENKTNVNKETILSLAKKLQNSNMKDEKVIREVIQEVGSISGKNVSKENAAMSVPSVKIKIVRISFVVLFVSFVMVSPCF